MFLRVFQHLLPNARAWRITTDKKLRQFFEGLTGLGDDAKTFYDLIYNDLDPQNTRELDALESQFGLPNTLTDEQERRDRLEATWSALGGQDPRYIQDTLQAAGFDVYVHEWWVPGSEPAVGVKAAATARNPFTYLNDGTGILQYLSTDGGVDMQDGDALAMDGATIQPTGYPLVNKIFELVTGGISDGSADMQDGDALAMDGTILRFYTPKIYQLPADVSKYPYFLYIGGINFPDHADVSQSRKNEFETLCLKICPNQQWLGILVNYS